MLVVVADKADRTRWATLRVDFTCIQLAQYVALANLAVLMHLIATK